MKFFIKYLDEADYKTRMQWLIAWFCLNVLFPLVLHGVICGILFYFSVQEEPAATLLGYAVGGLISTCLVWHFIVKMPGTKLLTLILFISPGQSLQSVIQVLSENLDLFQIIALSVEVILFVWCYWLTIKVRRINRKLAVWNLKPRSLRLGAFNTHTNKSASTQLST